MSETYEHQPGDDIEHLAEDTGMSEQEFAASAGAESDGTAPGSLPPPAPD